MKRRISCQGLWSTPDRTWLHRILCCCWLCLSLAGCWSAPGATPPATGPNAGGREGSPEAALCARAPEVSAWTAEAGADESIFLTGSYLPADTGLRIQPAVGGPARELPAQWSDGRHLLAVLPADLPLGPLLAAVGREGCWSESFSLNAPQPWWAYPEKPAPGSPIRVFGRGLQEASGLYLEAVDGPGHRMTLTDRSAHWVETRLPADLPPGTYRLRVEASGRRWSNVDAIDLQVAAAAQPSRRVVAVESAAALYAALTDLADTGGTIRLGEGRYLLQEPLRVPAGVRLQGAGSGKTVLTFGKGLVATPGLAKPGASYERSARSPDPMPGREGLPAVAGVLLFGSDAGLADLSITGGGVLQQGVAIAGTRAEPVERIRLNRIRVAELAPLTSFRPTHGQAAAVLARHVRSLEVRDSTLLGNGPALYLEDVADSAFIGNALAGAGEGVITGREGGVRRCRIEDNRFLSKRDGAPQAIRAIWLSTLFGSTYENHIAGNVGSDFHPPPGTDQNRGEAILLETALSHPYFGHPAAAGERSLTLPPDGPDWSWLDADDHLRGTQIDSYFAVVLAGRGQGQVRRIVARHDRTLELERPWRVAPDADSTVLLTELFYRNLIVGNEIRDALTGVQLWINGVENVIADNRLADFNREGILVYSLAAGGDQSKVPFWPIAGHDLAGFNRGVGVNYFNVIRGNSVTGAAVGISVSASASRGETGPIEWPTSLGNLVRNNVVDRVQGAGIWTGIRKKTEQKFSAMPGFALTGNIVERNRIRESPLPYGGDDRGAALVFRGNQAAAADGHPESGIRLQRPARALGWLTD